MLGSRSNINSSDESDEDCWRSKDYEDSLQIAGFGKFQYLLTLACGWANASDAVEILCVSFILPSIGCDMGLSSNQKGILSASMFLGMMIGGYGWGHLSDHNGRRQILVVSLTFNAVMALISSVCQGFTAFAVFRFLSGVGVGGSIPVVFSYHSEFMPKQHRGKMISVVAFFWMCGNIIGAALAWLIIPHTNWGYTSDSGFQYPSWRVFTAACTLPSVTSAVIFFFLPESPKYLASKGHERKALRVLSLVYNVNNKISRDSYPVKSLVVRKDAKRPLLYSQDNPQHPRGIYKRVSGYFKQIFADTASLFDAPYTLRSLVMVVINFTLSFGYYGLWLWLPELLSRMDQYGGSPCSLGSKNSTSSDDCTDALGTTVYRNTFITSMSNLPGNLFTIALVDTIGRKLLFVNSMVLSGLSVLFLWAVSNATETVIMMCLFGGLSVIGWNVLDILLTELYPTSQRALAIGFMTAVGRIAAMLANLAFGALIDEHCAIPIVMVSGLMVLGGMLAVFLPSMQNRPLE